jgi:hypothetical protein
MPDASHKWKTRQIRRLMHPTVPKMTNSIPDAATVQQVTNSTFDASKNATQLQNRRLVRPTMQ